MSVKTMIHETDGIFFITITCYKWIPLFEITNTYDAVYKWFNYLKEKNHYISGYVIMPNHFHALIAFSFPSGFSPNKLSLKNSNSETPMYAETITVTKPIYKSL